MSTMDGVRLRRLRRLKNVPRWNGVPTIQTQTVDAHSFHTGAISLWLIYKFGLYWEPEVSTDKVLWWAMVHDEPEAVFGDTPSPAKAIIGKALKEFETKRGYGIAPNNFVKALVKVADCLEALVFCREEQVLGNRGLEYVIGDITTKYKEAFSQLIPFVKESHDDPLSPFDLDPETVLRDLWSDVHPEKHPVIDEIKAVSNDPVPF